ncbi:MAG: alpha/beta hydrolase [Bauldia litoralis]
MTSRSHYLTCAGAEIHVTAWGDPDKPIVVFWHGLARTGRDFDEAASALSNDYYCLCPDLIGRGLSQWSPGGGDYHLERYGEIAVALAGEAGGRTLRWVGTSLGGLIGIHAAAGPLRGRISHLVVNDVGPSVPEAALDRIVGYVGNPPAFDRVSELAAYLHTVYTPFGDNTDAFWRRMVETSCRRLPDGRVTVHYDPAIVSQMSARPQDLDLWDRWAAVDVPVLLLRGADSDVLPAAVAADMAARNPRCRMVEVDGYGHAPTLTREREIETIREFLATA